MKNYSINSDNVTPFRYTATRSTVPKATGLTKEFVSIEFNKINWTPYYLGYNDWLGFRNDKYEIFLRANWIYISWRRGTEWFSKKKYKEATLEDSFENATPELAFKTFLRYRRAEAFKEVCTLMKRTLKLQKRMTAIEKLLSAKAETKKEANVTEIKEENKPAPTP